MSNATSNGPGGSLTCDDDALIEAIASEVRARLMAGGDGPGYTRSALGPSTAADNSLKVLTVDELRKTPCYDDPATCGGCGMCVVRRPWDAKAILDEGAVRLGAARIRRDELPALSRLGRGAPRSAAPAAAAHQR